MGSMLPYIAYMDPMGMCVCAYVPPNKIPVVSQRAEIPNKNVWQVG
jgi:hypothetical protein